MFNPCSPGIMEVKEISNIKEGNQNKEKEQEIMKEITIQWVNRAFAGNKVIMNQSYQEISSQSLNTYVIVEQE